MKHALLVSLFAACLAWPAISHAAAPDCLPPPMADHSLPGHEETPLLPTTPLATRFVQLLPPLHLSSKQQALWQQAEQTSRQQAANLHLGAVLAHARQLELLADPQQPLSQALRPALPDRQLLTAELDSPPWQAFLDSLSPEQRLLVRQQWLAATDAPPHGGPAMPPPAR